MPKNKGNKNKISLFVPNLKGGGAERAMVNLANEISKNKNLEVDLILAKKEGTYLKEVGHAVRVINLRSSNVPQSLFPLIGYLKKEKPDVLISTLAHASVTSILAKILSRSRTKIIVRMANTFSKVLKNTKPIERIILFCGVKIFFNFADEIIAVSGGVADDLARTIKISRNNIKVICNSVDLNKIENKCKEQINHPWIKNKKNQIILAVGRLTIEKDYPTLIKAFSMLLKISNFRLIILGEGKKRNDLENLIKSLKLEEKVDLPGFVENPFAYIKKADVFVLSSSTEGSPNTLLEAMACGAPVVSTDCQSGPREILDNGKYGQLVKVGDANALAEAILETIKNPLNADELKKRIRDNFSLEKAVGKYLVVIQKHLNI